MKKEARSEEELDEAFMGAFRSVEEGEEIDPSHQRSVHGELLVPTRLYGPGSPNAERNE